jgi:hypothetical protein
MFFSPGNHPGGLLYPYDNARLILALRPVFQKVRPTFLGHIKTSSETIKTITYLRPKMFSMGFSSFQ